MIRSLFNHFLLHVVFCRRGFWNFLLPAVGTVVSSLIGAKSAKDTNEAQIRASERAFDKQKKETDTAHQREVLDLRAAGLNPVLSAKYGGASSAQQVTPNLKTPYERFAGDVNSAVSTYYNTRLTKEQIETQKTQQSVNSAMAQKAEAERRALHQRTRQEKVRADVYEAEKRSKTNWFRRNITAPIGQALSDFNPFKGLFSTAN